MKQSASTHQDRSFKFLILNFKLSIFLNRFFFFLATLIVALAFFVRLHNVTQPNRYIFDEDFHAFTASQAVNDLNIIFEWWHPPFNQSINPYTYRPPAIEWLHPPVAKYIWMMSIKWLGNNPLAWRLPSVIFGTLNVALIIWLTLILTHRQDLSLLAGVLLAIERLSITQSQIAMNDVFLTTWLLLATIFYLLGINKNLKLKTSSLTNKQDSESSIQHPVSNIQYLVSSIFLGLAIATKWNAFWVLPVFFLHYLLTQIRKSKSEILNHRHPKRHSRKGTGSQNDNLRDSESHLDRARWVQNDNASLKSSPNTHYPVSTTCLSAGKSSIQYLVSSVFYFIIIPFMIYFLSYLPLIMSTNGLSQFIKLHQEIIHYQTTANFNHPYASQPWQWIYGQKPVYYALKKNGDGIDRVAQINPLLVIILTGGLFASLVLVILKVLNPKLEIRNSKQAQNSKLKTQNLKSKIYNLKLSPIFYPPASAMLQTLRAGLPSFISLSLWLPWFFIQRPKFIYYLTPIVPFLIINLMVLIQVFPSKTAINLQKETQNKHASG